MGEIGEKHTQLSLTHSHASSCHILSRALQGPPLRYVEVVIRAQVFNEVILTRESIAAFPRAVLDWAVTEYREMYARLMALEVCETCESLTAVVAGKWLRGPNEAHGEVSNNAINDRYRVRRSCTTPRNKETYFGGAGGDSTPESSPGPMG